MSTQTATPRDAPAPQTSGITKRLPGARSRRVGKPKVLLALTSGLLALLRPAVRHASPAVPQRALLPGIGVTVVVTSRTSSAPAAIAFLLGYLAAFVPIVRYALPRDLTCVTNPRHPLR